MRKGKTTSYAGGNLLVSIWTKILFDFYNILITNIIDWSNVTGRLNKYPFYDSM